jgi:hypothetical protein
MQNSAHAWLQASAATETSRKRERVQRPPRLRELVQDGERLRLPVRREQWQQALPRRNIFRRQLATIESCHSPYGRNLERRPHPTHVAEPFVSCSGGVQLY